MSNRVVQVPNDMADGEVPVWDTATKRWVNGPGGAAVDADDTEMLYWDDADGEITGTANVLRQADGNIEHYETPRYKTDYITYLQDDRLEILDFLTATRAGQWTGGSSNATEPDLVATVIALVEVGGVLATSTPTSFKLDINAHATYGNSPVLNGSRVLSVAGVFDGSSITLGTVDDLTPSNQIAASLVVTLTDETGGEIGINVSANGDTRWHGQYQITIIASILP